MDSGNSAGLEQDAVPMWVLVTESLFICKGAEFISRLGVWLKGCRFWRRAPWGLGARALRGVQISGGGPKAPHARKALEGKPERALQNSEIEQVSLEVAPASRGCRIQVRRVACSRSHNAPPHPNIVRWRREKIYGRGPKLDRAPTQISG